ncbi:hypothetical protein MSM1_17540 [Mycobacterium sp. SM1]|uniref:hypothetical protein n=1 Tax=Mycobacterium sp. SM1 TaxID=2816243 RepID=UPI001BCE1B78|nr:hypothetical protein [Mycobacterium sp. SM1]MBS4730063.1 hypothetical protein [Mycobacterium sp. SM1]
MPQRFSVLAAVQSGDPDRALSALARRVAWQLGRTTDARAVSSLAKTLMVTIAQLEALRERERRPGALAAELCERRAERQRRAAARAPNDPGQGC